MGAESTVDMDVVHIARQSKDVAAVHGCLTDAAVPWLALDDLIEVIALLTTEPMEDSGRSRARYHPVAPAELVTALCSCADWDLDMASRVPSQQLWSSSGLLPNHLIEQALHRPLRSLHACMTQGATAVPLTAGQPSGRHRVEGAPHA